MSVGGDLHVANNDALTSLSGLDALTSVGGGVTIEGNGVMTSLSGLDALTSVGEDLTVESNAQLCGNEVSDLVKHLTEFDGTVTNNGNDGVCP
jgi:hypothetical protein